MTEEQDPPEAHHRYRLGPPPVVLPRTANAEAKDGSMYSRGIDKRRAKRETMQHAKPEAEKANGRNMLVRAYKQRTQMTQKGKPLRKDNNLFKKLQTRGTEATRDKSNFLN